MAATEYLVEGARSFFLVTPARLVRDDIEIAWAEAHVKQNPNLAYVLGRYVGGGAIPNLNKQAFRTEDLRASHATLQYCPVNVNHNPARIVGAFVASELVYPTQTAAATDDKVLDEPYVEALAAIWKNYCAAEYQRIKAASDAGIVAYSMESVPTHLQCDGEFGCGKEFAYDGRRSLTYCAHLNDGSASKLLINPRFIGGALILPPAMPGWQDANVYQLIAREVATMAERADSAGTFADPPPVPDITDGDDPDGGNGMEDPEAWEQKMEMLVRLGKVQALNRSAGMSDAAQDPQLSERQRRLTDARIARMTEESKVLTTKARDALKDSEFAIPEKRAYPIQDIAHARNALARVDEFGTDDEKSRVHEAVSRRYPGLGK